MCLQILIFLESPQQRAGHSTSSYLNTKSDIVGHKVIVKASH